MLERGHSGDECSGVDFVLVCFEEGYLFVNGCARVRRVRRGSMFIISPYFCRLINKKEIHVNARLGTDHHQLIMPPISKDCSNTFLERSFIYPAPCEWNKLSEHIRTSNFDYFRKR